MYYIYMMLSVFTFLFSQANDNAVLTIVTKSKLASEIRVKNRLLELYKEYDFIKKWQIKDSILIDSSIISRSHPIITLNTRYMKNDIGLISTYIHEQLHWFIFNSDSVSRSNSFKSIKKIYPNVPVGRPEGARSEFSTYLHLIVCSLEYRGLQKLFGKEIAINFFKSKKNYTWIYNEVITNEDQIVSILKKNNLLFLKKAI